MTTMHKLFKVSTKAAIFDSNNEHILVILLSKQCIAHNFILDLL